MNKVRCWTFSYEEAEAICRHHEPCKIVDFNYDSCENVYITIEYKGHKVDVPMIHYLCLEYPEIPDFSVCFYADGCQIFPKIGHDIIVIGGIGRYNDSHV